jgi:putative heme-binding domain-containing protein
MDNPVEVVFTPGGERIFTTTFLQNPAGGKRDGIIHAVYGGIYGKVHDVIDDHPHTSPDVMPVLVHLGPAACCGLVRYESDTFGPEYRDNLFASSFNLHKVTRHVLNPDGATFDATTQDFLVCDSLDFHPTHLIEDADGSLVVIDTGGWYKLCCPTSQIGKPDVLGAIYRVKRSGAKAPEDPRGLKLAWDSMGAQQLAKLLGDPRPAVCRRAIRVLASEGESAIDAVAQVLRNSDAVEAKLNGIWTATQIEGDGARALVRSALHDANETVRQAAAHSASVRLDRDAIPDLLHLLDNGSAQNRRVAAEALGRVGNASVISAILAQIEKPNDRVLDHSLTYALIEIADARATAEGLKSSNPRVRRSAMMALDQMEGGSLDARTVASELTSSDAALRDTAAWIAGRHPQWGEALAGVLRKRLASPPQADANQQALQNQLARLAKSTTIQNLLADQAVDSKSPSPARQIAFGAMAESNLKSAPDSWISAISQTLESADDTLVADAVMAAAKLQITGPQSQKISEQLGRVAGHSKLPAALRLQALSAISGRVAPISSELFGFLLSRLAPDQPAGQRLIAAQVLGKCELTTPQLESLTESVKSAGPLEIEKLLAAFDQTQDESTGRKLLEALRSARSLKSLRAESLKPHLDHFGPRIQKEAEPLLASLKPDAEKQKARLDQLLATLPSGDVRRGQVIFNSAKLACATCHAIGYVGGNVGPDLTRVGAIRAERDLLEGILDPSASFVQSFQPMMVDTRSGDRQYGIVRADNAEEVVLITGPNQEVHIRKQDVKEMRPGTLSLMPEGFDQQLSPQELADLLAFLKACR